MESVRTESLTTGPALMTPQHVAIIMDGNGRWAKARGHSRFYGHVRGASRVREIVRAAKKRGVKALTLYAFSTENWKRPPQELAVLWKLLRKYVRNEVDELNRQGVRLHVIGEWERLPADVQSELRTSIELLSKNNAFELTFALSYGGRAEIVDATKKIAAACASGALDPQRLDENIFAQYLWTSSLHKLSDVDFVIRTSGELRWSNFLLWQASYAEFDFPQTLWPDYTAQEFEKSLDRYGNRERRFGGTI